MQGMMFMMQPGDSEETKKTEVKNTILAVQNALVDYVAEEGDNLMPTRGAAFLKIMGKSWGKIYPKVFTS